jgi:signal transduction histidine kinase
MCLQRLKIDPEASKKSAASLKVDKIEESIDQVKQDYNELEQTHEEIKKQYSNWEEEQNKLLELNDRLATINAESANLMAELEETNETLQRLNKRLATANAQSAELMVEVEEKNVILERTNKDLARANAHAAELIAIIELKEDEIQALNKSLSRINARSADLVAERELQMEEISNLNRNLRKEIKDRKKIEQQLIETNGTKDRFFSIIAHDLRNPFNSIVDLITLINEHAEMLSKEDIMEMITELYTNAEKTKELLEGLLQWRKVQSGEIQVEAQSFDLKTITNDTISILSPHAESKQIKIIARVEENITAVADKNMIATVIRNLISNAIKFTPKNGRITVSCYNDTDKLFIHIKDTGMGIEKEDIDKLFRIDKKVSRNGTANEKGSGLGLILCKEFVEKNGGKISVVSTPGEGSTFSFFIPIFEGS